MGADTFPRPGAACRVKTTDGMEWTGTIIRRFVRGGGWWVMIPVSPVTGVWDEIPAKDADIERVDDVRELAAQ